MSGFWVQITETRHRWYPSQEAYDRACGVDVNEAHNVIQDSMDATWHPATGEILESKSEFRRRTKAAGCVEIAGMDLNPGQKEVQVAGSDYEIGKGIHDIMEANRITHKDIQREVKEYFERFG